MIRLIPWPSVKSNLRIRVKLILLYSASLKLTVAVNFRNRKESGNKILKIDSLSIMPEVEVIANSYFKNCIQPFFQIRSR